MKQYCISFLYEKNGLYKIATGFMKPTGKVTREEIELWMDKIKEELGLEQKIVILNVFELENGVACPHREYCPSRFGWCERKNQDYENLEQKIVILDVFELENGVACPHREYCPSRSGWCERKNQDYEKCIPYILSAYLRVKSEKDQWRKEAIMMAAAAGEKKIEEFNEKAGRRGEG